MTDAPQAAPRPIANKRSGNDSTISMSREMKVSSLPPRNPAISPRAIPMTSEIPVAMIAISRDVRAP